MKYVLRKLTTLIITLFIVSLLAFLAFQVIPGSPATSMLGTNATPEKIAALEAELAYVTAHKLPLVLCTTGLSSEQIAAVNAAAEMVPIFFSSNMSLGVAVLSALTKKAAAVLGDTFDIEIVEMHHNQKLDAPSGTALMLADAAKAGLNYEPESTYDRHSRRQKRDKKEIGIASLRGGTVVGEHSVYFAGEQEVITLSHSAGSRSVFAGGALTAAAFIASKAAGMYSMEDILAD